MIDLSKICGANPKFKSNRIKRKREIEDVYKTKNQRRKVKDVFVAFIQKECNAVLFYHRVIQKMRLNLL
jgi:hypothetical protein